VPTVSNSIRTAVNTMDDVRRALMKILQDMGIIKRNTVTVDAAYSITRFDSIIYVDAEDALPAVGINITLPPTGNLSRGFQVDVKKIDISTNKVTIKVDNEDTETIDLATDLEISTPQASRTLSCNGGALWHVL